MSDGNPPILISHEQFASALEAAAAMDPVELREHSGAGVSRKHRNEMLASRYLYSDSNTATFRTAN